MFYFDNVYKSALTLFAVLMLSACAPDPQDDIPLFKSYIKENIDKSSDDPYISSYVTPKDDMYQFLRLMQQGRGELEPLEPLILNGNTEAMVWKARTNSNDINVRSETITLLGKAMKAGDPLAALALSSGGEECWWFGKGSLTSLAANDLGEEIPSNIETCSEENWNKAQQGIKKLADKGDLSAQYYLLKRERIDNPEETRESRDKYIKEIIRLAEGHYYKPLKDYVDSIFERKVKDSQLTGKTPELEKLAVDLMMIAASHNYIPAINFLIDYQWKTISINNPLFDKGMMLGSGGTVSWLLTIFAKHNKSIFSQREIYFYASIYEFITGNNRYLVTKYKEGSLSEEERQKIDAEVAKVTEQITPMVYIDRFTDRTNWVDR
ncbi:hypothetical protein BIY22_03765 [Vibrio panuliri]|uniref:HEAT repeat domain-containing protein n=1 Tax=Vibrio panuliri TaxID=1381081 RepID=A0A1Q9HII8_9VIBR|nr:hypothetical protein [Vibrio panuliri]OLQ90131.1 hypothetical protein BIY22_03765 [Vibrio panuliri]